MSERIHREEEQQSRSDFDMLSEMPDFQTRHEEEKSESGISAPVAEFLEKNGIDPSEIQNGLSRHLYSEDEIDNVWRDFSRSSAHDEKVFIGDIIGSQAIDKKDGLDLVAFLSELYSSGSDYNERSNRFLNRDIEENAAALLSSMEPMDFVRDGEKYFLCGDGNHRLFYLAAALEIELKNAQTPEERRQICERYTIPAKVCDVEFPSSVKKNEIEGLEDETDREGKLIAARGVSEVRERENGTRIIYSDYLGMYDDFNEEHVDDMEPGVRRQMSALIYDIGHKVTYLDIDKNFHDYLNQSNPNLGESGQKHLDECLNLIRQIKRLGRESGCEDEVSNFLSSLEDIGDAGAFIVGLAEFFDELGDGAAEIKENESSIDDEIHKLDDEYAEIVNNPKGIDMDQLRDLSDKYLSLRYRARNDIEEARIMEHHRRVTKLIDTLESLSSFN